MLRKIWLGSGIGCLALYAVLAFTGWELGTPGRERIPVDVRNSPGGYRSFHFWHAGYHGGK
jgi:hypothetical protein